MRLNIMKTFISCLSVIFLLSACNFGTPTVIKQDLDNPQPSVAPSAVQPTMPPTSFPLDVPSAGSLPPAVPASNQTVGEPENQTVQVFLVALEDGGHSGSPIGCGDSLVPVDIKIQATKGVLRAAIQALLSINSNIMENQGSTMRYISRCLKLRISGLKTVLRP